MLYLSPFCYCRCKERLCHNLLYFFSSILVETYLFHGCETSSNAPGSWFKSVYCKRREGTVCHFSFVLLLTLLLSPVSSSSHQAYQSLMPGKFLSIAKETQIVTLYRGGKSIMHMTREMEISKYTAGALKKQLWTSTCSNKS